MSLPGTLSGILLGMSVSLLPDKGWAGRAPAGVRQGQEGKSMFCICATLIQGRTRCLQVLQHMAGVRYGETLLVPRIERF